MSRTSVKKIGIVGAGLTGMTTALELSKAGHAVTVIEGGTQAGGLAGGLPFEGTNLEHAYHHVFKTDVDMLELIEELGIMDSLKWFDSSIGIYYDKQLFPFRTPMDLLRFSPLSLLSKLRLGGTVLYLQLTKKWERFVDVSAADWMRRYCGQQAYGVIWKPLLHGKFHQHANNVSMAWLWARIHIRANSKERGDSTEKLGYMEGGFRTLIDEMVGEGKNRGVKFQFGDKVNRIEKDGEGVRVETEGGSEIFDDVIVTVSSHIFSSFMNPEDTALDSYRQQLESISYLGAVLVVFSSEQSLNPYYWVNVNDPESPFLAFIQHTNLTPKEWYNNRHVYYVATYVPHDHRFFSIEDGELQDEFFTYLKKMFPDFSEEQIRSAQVIRMKYAQHVVDGRYSEKIPSHETPIPHVYVTNFSQIFPEDRGMSYAIREGKKMARLVDSR